MNNNEQSNSIFPKGDRAPAAYFTGITWVKTLVTNNDTYNCTVSNVVFEAGARNFWHTHPAGQILLATEGIGYFQEKVNPYRYYIKEMW